MNYDSTQVNEALIPRDTWCKALIVNAEEKVSKGGNEMIKTDFQIYDIQGLHPIISHYFVATPSGLGFLKKLCDAIGIDFSKNKISAEELKGKSISVLIKIQEDKTGQYPDKNVLAGFAKDLPVSEGSQQAPKEEENDGMPF